MLIFEKHNNNNKNNMPLLCYKAKHVFYIPPVVVVWRRSASQTGAFANNHDMPLVWQFII
jgi:hypothetical protein